VRGFLQSQNSSKDEEPVREKLPIWELIKDESSVEENENERLRKKKDLLEGYYKTGPEEEKRNIEGKDKEIFSHTETQDKARKNLENSF
jgi:hypothetical protein